MGFMKGLRDLKDLNDMARQQPRPSMSEGISQAKAAMEGVQQMQQLNATGVAGTAKLLAVADTGATLNQHPVCELQLEVTVPGHAPYTTAVRQPVPRMQAPMLQPGATMAVKVDPEDPTAVVMDWNAQAGYAASMAQSAAASAAAAQAPQDPASRLERLAALKEKGLLTDAEFEAQKAKILGEL
jgi:membrane protease subunit (stomatin/prohibitin family)